MPLKRIVLRLARNPDFPDGDDRQGYVIVAPLDAAGKIDVALWRAAREKCTVDRFHPDPDETADGLLTHRGITTSDPANTSPSPRTVKIH